MPATRNSTRGTSNNLGLSEELQGNFSTTKRRRVKTSTLNADNKATSNNLDCDGGVKYNGRRPQPRPLAKLKTLNNTSNVSKGVYGGALLKLGIFKSKADLEHGLGLDVEIAPPESSGDTATGNSKFHSSYLDSKITY